LRQTCGKFRAFADHTLLSVRARSCIYRRRDEPVFYPHVSRLQYITFKIAINFHGTHGTSFIKVLIL
jgi:hypothetical protein